MALAISPAVDTSMFDENTGYEYDPSIRLADGLSLQEQFRARVLWRVFDELWGLIFVVGDPGSGKDVFGNYLSHTVKRSFTHKRILRDERPTPLYGSYASLFNEETLVADLARMREAARGAGGAQRGEVMDKAADTWTSETGTVLLQHSVLYLTEYWRYCSRRETHSPMNRTMGGIHRMYRHLDCLIIGTVQHPNDLDRKTCLPYSKWRVNCVRSAKDTTLYTFLVHRVKYDYHRDRLQVVGRPFPLPVDAGKPRDFLGDGKIVVRKPDYRPETEEERLVFDLLRAGVDNYGDLVGLLEDAGDMAEIETLATLKELCLKLPNRRPKFAIWYPCYYFIYNSRSAPNMTTTVRA